jgi:hypothetical protein
MLVPADMCLSLDQYMHLYTLCMSVYHLVSHIRLASDKVRRARSPMVLHGSTDRWICNNVVGTHSRSMLVILFVSFHIKRHAIDLNLFLCHDYCPSAPCLRGLFFCKKLNERTTNMKSLSPCMHFESPHIIGATRRVGVQRCWSISMEATPPSQNISAHLPL